MLKMKDGWKDDQNLDDQNLDDLNLVAKMKDDLMKRMRRDGWTDDQNLGARNRGAAVSHPCRAPLFRF
jgi:hypothetical protein